jgi:hypothetical protein
MSTTLGQRMQQDLQMAGIVEGTQTAYLRVVRPLAAHFRNGKAIKTPAFQWLAEGCLKCGAQSLSSVGWLEDR